VTKLYKFLARYVVFDFYSKKFFFIATRIQKSMISTWYYKRNNLDSIFVCTRFSFSTKQLLWRGTCLANRCKWRCSLRRITSKDLWTNLYGSHPLGFLFIFLYKFLCSLAWGWPKYRPKHAACMWRQFNWLNKLWTSLDNYFSWGTDPIYSYHSFVKIVVMEMMLA
jgi:hypothetical protein